MKAALLAFCLVLGPWLLLLLLWWLEARREWRELGEREGD